MSNHPESPGSIAMRYLFGLALAVIAVIIIMALGNMHNAAGGY